MNNKDNPCAIITVEYMGLLGGGPAMAEALTEIVRPKEIVSQSVYAWANGRNDPNPYMLHFIILRTEKGTPAHEWARRCLESQGFGDWIKEE